MTSVACPGTETLRIAIVSTPKTGNTWLKLLFSEIYGLPTVTLPPSLPSPGMDFGPRWVAHQHYLPDPALIEWGRRHQVVFVTPVRHPGDVLVSLRHYLDLRSGQAVGAPSTPEHLLGDPRGIFGPHTRAYVEHGFFLLLQNSIAWICGGWSLPVRYEALYEHPLETLRGLTEAIHPVDDARLEKAIDQCAIGRLQKRSATDRQFFRRGGSGGWRNELPQELQRILLATEPYRSQFDLLGYPAGRPALANPDAADLLARSAVARQIVDEAAPRSRAAFAALAPALSVAWLNRRAAADPSTDGFPLLSELAYQLYRRVPEAQKEYPELFGRDRVPFAQWFLHFGLPGYGLDRAFSVPVIRSWSAGPGAGALRALQSADAA